MHPNMSRLNTCQTRTLRHSFGSCLVGGEQHSFPLTPTGPQHCQHSTIRMEGSSQTATSTPNANILLSEHLHKKMSISGYKIPSMGSCRVDPWHQSRRGNATTWAPDMAWMDPNIPYKLSSRTSSNVPNFAGTLCTRILASATERTGYPSVSRLSPPTKPEAISTIPPDAISSAIMNNWH